MAFPTTFDLDATKAFLQHHTAYFVVGMIKTKRMFVGLKCPPHWVKSAKKAQIIKVFFSLLAAMVLNFWLRKKREICQTEQFLTFELNKDLCAKKRLKNASTLGRFHELLFLGCP